MDIEQAKQRTQKVFLQQVSLTKIRKDLLPEFADKTLQLAPTLGYTHLKTVFFLIEQLEKQLFELEKDATKEHTVAIKEQIKLTQPSEKKPAKTKVKKSKQPKRITHEETLSAFKKIMAITGNNPLSLNEIVEHSSSIWTKKDNLYAALHKAVRLKQISKWEPLNKGEYVRYSMRQS